VAGLNLSFVDPSNVFFPYNGPSPPRFLLLFPRQRRQLFLYEWIIAKQLQSNGNNRLVRDTPRLTRNFQVQYQSFLNETKIVASSYFQSGFCVRPRRK
jgi:hypothetical protein